MRQLLLDSGAMEEKATAPAPSPSPKEDKKDHKEHPHSAVPRPALSDAVGYGVEVDSHEPDALEGDAFPATIHAVNVEKGTATVSYEVDDGALPDYQRWTTTARHRVDNAG